MAGIADSAAVSSKPFNNGVHHTVVQVSDLDASINFYSNGIGLDILSRAVDGSDYSTLFDTHVSNVSAAFLGDKSRPDDHSGILELAQFGGLYKHGRKPMPFENGASWFSFLVDVEQTLSRLAKMGLGGQPHTAQVRGETWSSVHDPDGVIVLLIPQNTSVRAN
ncbi:hypothetical protein CFAM422_013173 [Trichoderma lentiforme]|uniref:VOC domain-containing protein n=1 Tax=Trichoderma lentiforme TaxID=1567552 RepID=A0A9P4X2J8_9HYPO|nr:hypothetical protein CFAM422_013173 [Trichoderma lentiforme]